jgi:transcriptional antiterminator RfaH
MPTGSQIKANEIRWYALQVKSRAEKMVGARLSELGFDVCVPTQKQLRVWSDRKKLVDVVLFSNYVFVATDHYRKNEVFQVGNIFKYVQFGGKIATLTAEEVALVKRLSRVTENVQISYESFAPGDEVEIVAGSLAGFRGRVTAVNGASRIQLALPSLYCFANVEVKGADVRRVDTVNKYIYNGNHGNHIDTQVH